MRRFMSVDELRAAIGEDLGPGDWLLVDQERVDLFARATGDEQWIHLDVERARSGPFGATIAHGYLTLSLLPVLGASVFSLDTPGAKLNYGVNKVRFPQPLLVGKRVRARASVVDVAELGSGVQVILRTTVEIEGEAKPACVAESVVLLLS
ncbi:MaoC family dehydratase [Nocardioides jishulii]|nr:MaoC family dehydratase [Nocardioides jishulii]